MTDLIILDTGKRSVSSTTATEVRSPGDDGNDGTNLTLKGAEASLNIDVMTTDDSPVLKKYLNIQNGYYTQGEADTVGIQLPVWSIRGYVNRTSLSDMKTLGRLIFMCKTAGYKELYSADTSADATADGWHDIIAFSHYGENELNNAANLKVTKINVRIKSFSVTQSADKKGFNYTINLVETN